MVFFTQGKQVTLCPLQLLLLILGLDFSLWNIVQEESESKGKNN